MKTVITIGRQFGSGGREIGEKLAKAYDIPYYDRELLPGPPRKADFVRRSFRIMMKGRPILFFIIWSLILTASDIIPLHL